MDMNYEDLYEEWGRVVSQIVDMSLQKFFSKSGNVRNSLDINLMRLILKKMSIKSKIDLFEQSETFKNREPIKRMVKIWSKGEFRMVEVLV